MTENEKLIVEGYRFQNEEDAELARIELEKVKMLESRMDYSNTELMISMYHRAIENRTFKTPVGYDYLQRVREYLLKDRKALEADLKPIPMYVRFAPLAGAQKVNGLTAGSIRTDTVRIMSMANQSGKKDSVEKRSAAYRTSIAANIILVILVIAMFIITIYSNHPNILNYKRNLLNEYASWEQQLTEREQEVRQKEKELGIEVKDIPGEE